METRWKVICRGVKGEGVGRDKRPPRLRFCFRARAPRGRSRGRWLGEGASSHVCFFKAERGLLGLAGGLLAFLLFIQLF